MNTNYKKGIVVFVLLFAASISKESEMSSVELLQFAQDTATESLPQESQPRDIEGRGLASISASVSESDSHNHHDCEKAREEFEALSVTNENLTEEDAMDLFLENPRGDALMNEFLQSVQNIHGEQVLRMDVAKEFEQSLEHLNHGSQSDAL